MTRRLLDSSTLIDFLRGEDRAVRFFRLAAEDDDDLWSVVVVRSEILTGMRAGEQGRTFHLFDQIQWLDVDRMVADLAGSMARQYRASHQGIDIVDYIVAAAALSIGAALATQNVKHFPMMAGLQPAY
jgi:predicted nucleic acid-binding protein